MLFLCRGEQAFFNYSLIKTNHLLFCLCVPPPFPPDHPDDDGTTVISNFNLDSSGLHQLRVTVGDTVLIHEELDGWYYGCLSHDRKQMGIFPKNFVVLRDAAVVSASALLNG